MCHFTLTESGSSIMQGNDMFVTYLISISDSSKHHNDRALLLEYHSPEVVHCGWQWSLCCYIPRQVLMFVVLQINVSL